jgi:hypothetical protein
MYANPKFKHIAILVPAVAKSFHANARTRKNKNTKAQQWLKNHSHPAGWQRFLA